MDVADLRQGSSLTKAGLNPGMPTATESKGLGSTAYENPGLLPFVHGILGVAVLVLHGAVDVVVVEVVVVDVVVVDGVIDDVVVVVVVTVVTVKEELVDNCDVDEEKFGDDELDDKDVDGDDMEDARTVVDEVVLLTVVGRDELDRVDEGVAAELVLLIDVAMDELGRVDEGIVDEVGTVLLGAAVTELLDADTVVAAFELVLVLELRIDVLVCDDTAGVEVSKVLDDASIRVVDELSNTDVLVLSAEVAELVATGAVVVGTAETEAVEDTATEENSVVVLVAGAIVLVSSSMGAVNSGRGSLVEATRCQHTGPATAPTMTLTHPSYGASPMKSANSDPSQL